MSLLTRTTRTNAELAEDIKTTGSLITAAALRMNEMAQRLLRLSDADLTEWLNASTPANVFKLFEDHFAVGTAVNQSVAAIAAQLEASDIPFTAFTVDTTSYAEKLARQNRQIEFVDGVFTVTTIVPPAPEPQPEPEPEGPAPEPEPQPEP